MGRLKQLGSRVGSLEPRLKQLPKTADPFYLSPEWMALVARRKRDPDYAAAKKRAKPGERLILDHMVERRDGGPDLDPANTVWRTMSEHQAKTAKARSERAQGRVYGRDGGAVAPASPRGGGSKV